MRVHPNQLSNGFFPFFGPSNLWVKSFNINNKKIVFPLCILFLISVIGSALNRESIKNKFSFLCSESSLSEPLAVVLSNANAKIFLFSAPSKSPDTLSTQAPTLSDLELTLTDKVFLEESRKLGALSVTPLADAAEFPLLKLRSVKELKDLLASDTTSEVPISYKIISRVFVPADQTIYGISDEGIVLEINSNGQISEFGEE